MAGENLEINIVPPATPDGSSTIRITGPTGLEIHLPLGVAGLMGATLIKIAAVAAERDARGSHVAPAPPAAPLIVV
jgi:hypothetical protein